MLSVAGYTFLLLLSRLFKVNFARRNFAKTYKNTIPFNALILMTALFGINSQGWGTALNLPSGGGVSTSWGTSGTVGAAAGNAIATTNGGGTAATFSVASSV